MSRFLSRMSMLLALLMIVSLLAACGGGGGDDDDDATATSAGAGATATTGSAAASPTSDVQPTPASPPTVASQASPIAATPTVEATATQIASGPVEVDALWFSSDGTSVQGGTSHVQVQVRENTSGELRVGFFESEVGGSGPQWRSAGWMAVITASLLLSENPADYEFSFDVAGRIDGPSAGALMTVAVLAALHGDTVNPAVTMTGTINPDGTIGPVGGIPHKLEGAAAAGKTTVLVPGGQRYDYDYALGQSVDLVQAGQALGITVKVVPDIYTAYRELTGVELPHPTGAGQAAMPSGAFDKYRAGAAGWISTYQAESASFYSLPADVQEYRIDLLGLADFYAGRADQYLGEGQVSAAFEAAFQAASWARIAREQAELDNVYYTQGLEALIAQYESGATAELRLGAVSQRLEAETARSASDSIAIMDAFSNLSVAQGLIFQANAAVNNLSEDYTEEDVVDAVYAANYFYINADLYLDLAEDTLSIGTGFGSAAPPDLDVLMQMSETLRRGAEANIAYFESIIIEPWAADNGVHPDLARYVFQEYDSSYLTAVAAVAGAESLAGTMLKPEAQAAVNLGSSLTAYSQSASLIAKYYSLGAQVDEFGGIVGYDRQSSLADMLDLADQRAREWLSVVADEDPVSALYYYENARLLRTGDANEQLSALNYYWQSAILSETLAAFSTPAE